MCRLKRFIIPPRCSRSACGASRARQFNEEWDKEVECLYNLEHGPLMSQGEVIGAVNAASGPHDIVLCAAGSLPGDLHKPWRPRDEFGYHLEYSYSCMGYEIAGGLDAKMATPDREVYVMVGDGSYLMMSQEFATALQEGIKINVVLINNHGFASIGGLSESIGSEGFGTRHLACNPATGQLNFGISSPPSARIARRPSPASMPARPPPSASLRRSRWTKADPSR